MMKPIQPPVISDRELNALAVAFKNNPQETVFRPTPNNGLGHTAYVFKKKGLVVFEGEAIGQGNWGTVAIGRKFSFQGQDEIIGMHRLDNSSCIIKKPVPGILNQLKHLATNFFQKTQIEAQINDKIYGDSDWLDAGEAGIITLQPFLGDLTLDKFLIEETNKPTLDFASWLTLFIQIANNLDVIHQKTDLINNDIKPENILLLLAKDNTGNFEIPPRIIAATIVDWGNAHAKFEWHLPGDVRYASPASCYFFKSQNNEKIDVFAMGKMFSEMLKIIITNSLTIHNQALINQCEALFKKMTSSDQANIPQLRGGTSFRSDLDDTSVIATLKAIKNTVDEKNEVERSMLRTFSS